MRCGGERCELGGGRAPGWWRHTRGMHGEKARLKAWGPRARAERTQNMPPMYVTLEVSKLSGWLKADARCRVEGRACDAGGERWEPGGGRAWGVVAAHKRHARGEGPTQGLGAKGTRGAHSEHVVHGRDAGGVEAQRLVEGRPLPSRREGMRCGGEMYEPGGGRAPGWWRHTRGMHGAKARLKALGPRARAERTKNMLLMSVTLEVSQPEMSALKPLRGLPSSS
jgi:hypothetical protein